MKVTVVLPVILMSLVYVPGEKVVLFLPVLVADPGVLSDVKSRESIGANGFETGNWLME